jgi:protocatechuate 3,4-dioxygenase beta subunit
MTRRGTDHEHRHGGEVHEHDRGLSHDLPTLMARRRLLGLLGGASAVAVAGCTSGPAGSDSPAGSGTGSGGSGTGSAGTRTGSGGRIPAETAGPFPGNGSNGVNALTASGIVRSDITRSFGGSSGVAAGVPLTVRLKVLDIAASAAPLTGAAVYLWHCDIDGRYSMYDQGVADENYLRGVQAADSAGWVTFTTIYPAVYPGRWPHMHFEVYPSLAAATTAGEKLRTSQLALPEDASRLAYASDGYAGSVRNLSRISLADDNVFSDGYSLQLATVTGSVGPGFTATLNVPV